MLIPCSVGYRYSPLDGTFLPATSNILTPQSNILAGTGGSYCIFVHNLPPETEDSTLWQLFGPCGAVQAVKIVRDNQSNKCKGYGFVTMTNYEEAVFAISRLNGLAMGSRILQVSFKKPKGT